MDHLKNAWKSLTIWFNGLLAAFVAGAPVLQEQLPQLASYIPADVYKQCMFVAIIGNIMLRFRTSNSLADKGSK